MPSPPGRFVAGVTPRDARNDGVACRGRRRAGEGPPFEDIISQTKKDGYASSVGGTEAGISAIALPIQGGGPVLGSLNLIFFTSSMTPEVAASRFLSNMKQAVRDIEQRWAAANKARGKVA